MSLYCCIVFVFLCWFIFLYSLFLFLIRDFISLLIQGSFLLELFIILVGINSFMMS